VNLLDVLIVAAAIAAAYGGYRLGFLARALSWAGLALGVVLAITFVDDLVNAFRNTPPRSRFLAALAFIFMLAVIGWTLGVAAAVGLHRHLNWGPKVHAGDRVAGVIVSLIGVFVAVWLVTPALASAPGWSAHEARDSAIVRSVARLAPQPPRSAEALGRFVTDVAGPQVFANLDQPDSSGTPPGTGLPPGLAARVSASVVRVEGQACDQIQEGSGFAAADNLVVTNAHVVAGEQHTTVFTRDGRRLNASVVAFDADRDIAVLRVAGLRLVPLVRGVAKVGTTGAVFGHPNGGPLQESPARVAQDIIATGTDIYRTSRTNRDVFVLAARLAPGDSGGAFVDAQGHVDGVAFAIDPSRSASAYALTREELDPVLDRVIASGAVGAISTGPCLG
jgi:S1-C subfamily serine protease